MRFLLALAAAVALLAATGACGSIITVPDQGVVVLGCSSPSACYRGDCSCVRKDAQPGGACTTPALASGTMPCNALNQATCLCPANVSVSVPDTDMAGNFDLPPPPRVNSIPVQCIETAQACIGRGVFCGGTGARCLPTGAACSSSGGDPPQLIAVSGIGPALEPHCQFVDDVCCPGVDGGVTD